MQELLRIRLPAQAHNAVRSKVLMHASYLVAAIIAICNDLAPGAERLAREWWTRMTFFFDRLVQIAPTGTIPVAAVVEELPKTLDRDLTNVSRVGGHESVGF